MEGVLRRHCGSVRHCLSVCDKPLLRLALQRVRIMRWCMEYDASSVCCCEKMLKRCVVPERFRHEVIVDLRSSKLLEE